MRSRINATLIGLVAVFFFTHGATREKEARIQPFPPGTLVEAPPAIHFSSFQYLWIVFRLNIGWFWPANAK